MCLHSGRLVAGEMQTQTGRLTAWLLPMAPKLARACYDVLFLRYLYTEYKQVVAICTCSCDLYLTS